jgi:hypothetical protein
MEMMMHPVPRSRRRFLAWLFGGLVAAGAPTVQKETADLPKPAPLPEPIVPSDAMPLGQLSSMDPTGRITTFVYDADGFLASHSEAPTSFWYHGTGFAEGSATVTTFFYDGMTGKLNS